ncbi:MAG TPA: hypothetical protein PKC28_05520 [Bdellovibrionales bacterium]|nr:hypothetical protein [Bdellovibrionales bacterium]
MKAIYKVILFTLSLALTPAAHAAFSPLGIGVVPPVQFPPEDFSITGARVSLLYGQHRDMYGLDVGVLGNITEQNFVGLAVAGGMNWNKGYTTILGLQLAGVANYGQEKTTVVGVQAALALNVLKAESSVTGLQLALANIAGHTSIYGLQVGIYNKALNVYGLQLGLVNVAQSLHGIQIGLINFHTQGLFSVSPILNIGF